MAELALYRKWRSRDFEELVGQPRLTQTLKNAISSGKIAHAYLFCGPRGTGKTSAAKILAKALNCEKGPTPSPCNACVACEDLTRGSAIDCIEIDAASNRGIDEIRDLREKVKFAPTQFRYKVYIIDEVHMLTPEAFNALLKTLEEPPPQTVFILCTTEPHKLLPTVASRCQRFDFGRISSKVIESRLGQVCQGEGIEFEPGVLALIAQGADGSLRDALSLLDQLRVFCQGKIGKEEALALLGQTPKTIVSGFMDILAQGDLKTFLVTLHQRVNEGVDLSQLVKDLIVQFRKILLVKAAPDILQLDEEESMFINRFSSRFEAEELYRILRVLTELRQEMRYSQHLQLSVEMGFMRILKAQWEPSLEGLRRRLDNLQTASPQLSPKNFSPAQAMAALTPLASETPVTLKTVQEQWPLLIEKLRVSRNTLFAILQESTPVELYANVLTLSFAYDFHKNILEQRKEEMEKLLKETFQFPLKFVGIVPTVEPESFIREVTELFPGTVIVGEANQ